MGRLDGRTALVTGGSRGIGRASVLALAREGARVLVHYGHARKEAEATVAKIIAEGGRAEVVSADMALPEGPHERRRKFSPLSAIASTSS